MYRYTKEGNINELRHKSMYGYENNRNSLVYRYTRTAPRKQNQPRRTRKEENSDKDSLRTEAEQTAYKNLKEIIPFLKDERGRQKYIQSQRPLCIFRNFLIAESYKGWAPVRL